MAPEEDRGQGPKRAGHDRQRWRRLALFFGVAHNDSSDDEVEVTSGRLEPDSTDGPAAAVEEKVVRRGSARPISRQRRLWLDRRIRMACRSSAGGVKDYCWDSVPQISVDDSEGGSQGVSGGAAPGGGDAVDSRPSVDNHLDEVGRRSGLVVRKHANDRKPSVMDYAAEGSSLLISRLKNCRVRHRTRLQPEEELKMPPDPSDDDEENKRTSEGSESPEGRLQAMTTTSFNEFDDDGLRRQNRGVGDGLGDGLDGPCLARPSSSSTSSGPRSARRTRGGDDYGVGVVGRVLRNKVHPAAASTTGNDPRWPLVFCPLRRRKQRRTVKEPPGDDVEDFRPTFSYWVTFTQVVVLALSMGWFGVAPFGTELAETVGIVRTEALTLDQVSFSQPSNFWVGPRAADLIRLGAKFSPCMRRDGRIWRRIERRNEVERTESGCCVRNDRSGCLQTTKDLCSGLLSTFYKWDGHFGDHSGPDGRRSGPVCGLDPRYCLVPASAHPHVWPDDVGLWPLCRDKKQSSSIGVLGRTIDGNATTTTTTTIDEEDDAPAHVDCKVTARPCCIGIHGLCQLKSEEYCAFVAGHFHPDASLCSQVNCMGDVCGMLPFLLTTGAADYSGSSPDQAYRLWTSLFLHAGVLHLLITASLQMWVMRDLEKLCGPLRMSLIYFGSGVVGNLASAVFVPYRAESGPSGALFGLLAALVVECLNAWPILRSPWRALLKLAAILALLFSAGFLPWVDNYAHLFGFFGGVSLSLAFLPYLDFFRNVIDEDDDVGGGQRLGGTWPPIRASAFYSRRGRIALVASGLLVYLALLGILLAVFYGLPDWECEWCKYLTCVPFTSKFCADQNIDFAPSKRYLF